MGTTRQVMAVILIALLALTNIATHAQEDLIYKDPQGRFSVPLGADWTVIELAETYGQFQYTEAPIILTFTAVTITNDIQDTQDAVYAAAAAIGQEIVSFEGGEGAGSWDLFLFMLRDGQGLAAAAIDIGDTVYMMLVIGEPALVLPPPLAITGLINQFTFANGDTLDLPASIEAFEAFVQDKASRDTVSISVAVSVGGQLVYSQGFGSLDGTGIQPSDANTVYQWGSSTKIVTATAVMQLWEKGLIDLDALVSDYLDYFPAEDGITVRHLLTHTSGLPEMPDVTQYISLNDGEQLDPDVIAHDYATQLTGLEFTPGSQYRYSNYGFLLLGEIVHAVSGMPYVDYVRQNILQPLGMTHTDFVYSEAMLANAAQSSDLINNEAYLRTQLELTAPGLADASIDHMDENYIWMHPFNVLPPWGGLHGPATEQLFLLNMYLNGGELNGAHLLQLETIAMMQEVQVGTPESGVGLAWMHNELLDQHYVGHAGGGAGISMEMMLFPDSGIAISVMTNRTGYNASAIAEAALNVTLALLGS